ncbi:MAG: YraN family protein [Actinobacteria bacterium]|nr:YraN family protein [Actinomycetota bacterium]
MISSVNTSANIDTRRLLGQASESAARRFLADAGWRIIAQNVRWREGELDLIGLDGNVLVFVEVKSLRHRNGSIPFSPFESIGRRKQLRIRSLARRWLVDELPRLRTDGGVRFTSIRFDAVAVTMGPGDRVIDLKHLADAF